MDLYHVLNRGTDKRDIFMDDQDRFRFIHDLFEFNDIKNVQNTLRNFNSQTNDVGRPVIKEGLRKRELLVEILAFCMMDNHYHLFLRPLVENGISLFMKKLNGGYTKYINERYDRSGALFQGRYKKVLIKTDAHFIYLPYYIHLNPLDFKFKEWREGELKNYGKAIKFLESYRWSSHLDYCGKKNFPSVTQRKFLLKVFGGEKKYEKNIKEWLENMQGIAGDNKDLFFDF